MARKNKQYGEVDPKKLGRAQLLEKALELRLRGFTYRDISSELTRMLREEYGKGKVVTTAQAHKMISEYYAKVGAANRETAEQLVSLQLDRLEFLWKRLQPLLGGEDGRGKLDVRAVEAANRLLERQSKLVGLDAPAKQEVKVSHLDVTDPELLDQVERLRLSVEASSASASLPMLLAAPLPGEESPPPAVPFPAAGPKSPEPEPEEAVDVDPEPR